jgi:hypothetical protein
MTTTCRRLKHHLLTHGMTVDAEARSQRAVSRGRAGRRDLYAKPQRQIEGVAAEPALSGRSLHRGSVSRSPTFRHHSELPAPCAESAASGQPPSQLDSVARFDIWGSGSPGGALRPKPRVERPSLAPRCAARLRRAKPTRPASAARAATRGSLTRRSLTRGGLTRGGRRGRRARSGCPRAPTAPAATTAAVRRS